MADFDTATFTAEDLRAANAFRETLLPKADAMAGNGNYPLWHGWALLEAFKAGAEYARANSSTSK